MFAVRLLHPADAEGEDQSTIASVWADSMGEAIAIAMRRYPGCLAVHGERH